MKDHKETYEMRERLKLKTQELFQGHRASELAKMRRAKH